MTAKDRDDEPPGTDVRPFLPRPGEPAEEYAARLRALHRDLTLVLEAVERGLEERRRAQPPVTAVPDPEAPPEPPAPPAGAEPVAPAPGPRVETLPPRAESGAHAPAPGPRGRGPSPVVVAALVATVLTVVAIVLALLVG